jgi:hypothetical protein
MEWLAAVNELIFQMSGAFLSSAGLASRRDGRIVAILCPYCFFATKRVTSLVDLVILDRTFREQLTSHYGEQILTAVGMRFPPL